MGRWKQNPLYSFSTHLWTNTQANSIAQELHTVQKQEFTDYKITSQSEADT